MARRPRILIAVTRLERGGAQLHALGAARVLLAAGYHVSLATGPAEALTPDAQAIDGLEVHEIASLDRPVNARRDLSALRSMRALIRNIDPDLVYSHSSKAGVLGRLAASGHRALKVHAVHGFAHHGASGVRRALFVASERRAAAHTDRFVFFSEADEATARELGLLSRGLAVRLPYGVDLEGLGAADSRRAAEQARTRLGLDPARPTLAVVANLKPQKEPEVTAEALALFLAEHDDWQVVWAGDGPARPAVERVLEPFRDRVFGPAWIEERTLPHRAADALALLSRHEGLPHCVIEALACAHPVVASAVPGTVELLRGLDGHRVVPVGDARAAAAALSEVARSPILEADSARAGRQRASAQGVEAFRARLLPFVEACLDLREQSA